ncbi:MAG: hypothetical protein HRU41_39905 [Saprospiraceae bacterium]|nr:hypothetical protein [Saprospiraceae bacterium]
MIKQIGFLLLSVILLSSCQTEPKGQEAEAETLDLAKTLPGTWEMVSLRVQVNSFENKDSSYVLNIQEEEWDKVYFVQPVKTYYELDNKYRRTYFNVNGEVVSEDRGMWNTFNDTLMMIEPNVTYQYIISQQPSGLLQFSAILDWDSDGQEDDEYLGVQRYVSRTTE